MTQQVPRPRKSYSDIGSSGDTEHVDIDISRASVATGEDHESTGEVSSGNFFRSEPKASELAFVAEMQSGRGNPESMREGTFQTSLGTGSVSNLLATALPRTKRARIRKAFEHAEGDDLLSSLIETLTDFTGTGFSLQIKPPSSLENAESETEEDDSEIGAEGEDAEDTEDDDAKEKAYEKTQEKNQKIQQRLDEVSIAVDAQKIVSNLIEDWFTCDSMILYWRTEPGKTEVIENGVIENETSINNAAIEETKFGIPGIIDIAVLKPSDVDWNNSIGSDVLMVSIPEALKNKINDTFMRRIGLKLELDEVYNSLMQEGIPRRWIDAVRNGRSEVQLLKENGDHWIIRTRARNYHGLACPRMYSIFLDLEIRKILKEGDASTALMMKHFVMLIKQGESIETGPLAGSTRNWLKKPEAVALLKRFSVTNRAMLAAVNHTTAIEFVFPPKEMFDGVKYVEPEKRIFNWAGVAQILSTGSDDKYAAGFLGIKRTIGKMTKCREEVVCLMRDFFMHETVGKKLGIPEGYSVKTSFDHNILKEPRQLLEEIKFLHEANMIDPRTALRELERDPDAIKASKAQSREENEALETWSPLENKVESAQMEIENQLKSAQDPGGRPANPGTERTAATRTQRPTAQQTENT